MRDSILLQFRNVAKFFQVSVRDAGWKGLLFSHTKKITALTGLNFDIEAGQVVGLVGPNGAGKSTLIKLMTGLISPSSGEIKRNISKDQTGVIFGHKCSLWWDLPVQYSFDNFAALYKLDKTIYKKRLEYLVDNLKIGHILDRDVRRLSLGERIKSELVSTLLHSPKFIFLDEPTIGMDLESKNSFRQCLVSFAKTEGMTIILSSHEMQDIETICSRTLILKQGELIYDGITSQLGESTTRVFIFLENSPGELPSYILEKCLDYSISSENHGVRLELECRHQDVSFILRYMTMTWEPISLEMRRTNLETQVLNRLKGN